MVGAAAVGANFVIGAMVLGAMAGCLLGGTTALFKSANIKVRAARPQPVATTHPVRVRATAHVSGD
jgi:hypothetical protein